jgi:hypothetical protein
MKTREIRFTVDAAALANAIRYGRDRRNNS